MENIPQVQENLAEVGQNHGVLGGLAYCFSLKVKWGFIPAQELERERSKSFPVFISLRTKAIRS